MMPTMARRKTVGLPEVPSHTSTTSEVPNKESRDTEGDGVKEGSELEGRKRKNESQETEDEELERSVFPQLC